MFEAMEQYLFDVCANNPGSFYKITTSTCGVFRAAFLTLGPVQELLRWGGLCSSGRLIG